MQFFFHILNEGKTFWRDHNGVFFSDGNVKIFLFDGLNGSVDQFATAETSVFVPWPTYRKNSTSTVANATIGFAVFISIDEFSIHWRITLWFTSDSLVDRGSDVRHLGIDVASRGYKKRIVRHQRSRGAVLLHHHGYFHVIGERREKKNRDCT